MRNKHHLKEEPRGQLLRLSFMVLSSYFLVISVILETPNAKFWGADRILILVLSGLTVFFVSRKNTSSIFEGNFRIWANFTTSWTQWLIFFPNQTRSLTLGVGQIHARYSQLVADPSNWEFGTSSQKTPKTLPETTSSHLHLKMDDWKTTDYLGMAEPGRCELLVSRECKSFQKSLRSWDDDWLCPLAATTWPCRLCVPPSRPMVWEQTACTEAGSKKVEKPKKVGDASENYVCIVWSYLGDLRKWWVGKPQIIHFERRFSIILTIHFGGTKNSRLNSHFVPPGPEFKQNTTAWRIPASWFFWNL